MQTNSDEYDASADHKANVESTSTPIAVDNSANKPQPVSDAGYFSWSSGRDMNFISGNDTAEGFANLWNEGLMDGAGGEIITSVPFWKNPTAMIAGAVIVGSLYKMMKR